MKPEDYSPPLCPTLEQQKDALRKGLGRARIWADCGLLDESALLEACLGDQRYDSTLSSCRGHWLWQSIQSLGVAARFRDPIYDALTQLSDQPESLFQEVSAYQLCELAYHYAATGDEPFGQQLYEIVKHPPNWDWGNLGEEELLKLEGERAFLCIAHKVGRRLLSPSYDRYLPLAVQSGADHLGSDFVERLLEDSRDPDIVRFREAWRVTQAREQSGSPFASPEQMISRLKAIGVQQIFENAAKGSHRDFRGWGSHARDEDLRHVASEIWTCRDPQMLESLLWVFSNRALPEFDSRLIELCFHPDESVRFRARRALNKNRHPLVRSLALSQIEHGLRDDWIAELFVRNYEAGDEVKLAEALEFPEDDNALHWLLQDIIAILEHNEQADCSLLGPICYFHNPCAFCRTYAAKLMRDRGIAPAWLAEECKVDSEEDCRNLFSYESG